MVIPQVLKMVTRREWPRDGPAAEQRDELAAFHCPMPPVLRTERIAHLNAPGDCCVAGFRPGLRFQDTEWSRAVDLPVALPTKLELAINHEEARMKINTIANEAASLHMIAITEDCWQPSCRSGSGNPYSFQKQEVGL